MSETRLNLIVAVRGYKIIKKEKQPFGLDVITSDNMDKKVLLRIIEPLTGEYTNLQDVESTVALVEKESYEYAILIGKHFTDNAIKEMEKRKIQYASVDHLPEFEIQDLYLAIVNCANSQCQKRCSNAQSASILDCTEKTADLCKIKTLVASAKNHFEDGNLGLLKNDLRVALVLNR